MGVEQVAFWVAMTPMGSDITLETKIIPAITSAS